MRIALLHDWLVAHRGGEQVLLALARMYPDAPIFTLVYEPEKVHPELRARRVHTSFLQRLPGVPGRFRHLLPLFPKAIESLDFTGFDRVISTSHCVAKGALLKPGQQHLSYVHTPMRYIWDELERYLPNGVVGRIARPWVERAVGPLRRWDVDSAQRPHLLLANSEHVRERISRIWGRESVVVYPPVDTEFFTPVDGPKTRELLVLGAQVPYKNAQLAVEVATARGDALRVFGDGPEVPRLKRMAGPSVVFEPGGSRERVRQLYRQARALLFCGVEDFGIVPVEAMACGCPVVALGRGGALETVVGSGAQRTGVFFDEPSAQSLNGALDELSRLEEGTAITPAALRERAILFSWKRFQEAASEANKSLDKLV